MLCFTSTGRSPADNIVVVHYCTGHNQRLTDELNQRRPISNTDTAVGSCRVMLERYSCDALQQVNNNGAKS